MDFNMYHPQQQHTFVPHPHHIYAGQGQQQYQPYSRAMTAADILASGEMLYSYDIPRPVPRSGATLFDPNADNVRVDNK